MFSGKFSLHFLAGSDFLEMPDYCLFGFIEPIHRIGDIISKHTKTKIVQILRELVVLDKSTEALHAIGATVLFN